MNPTPQLPEHLYAAYEWISAAGEWAEAKETPAQYATDAHRNAVANDVRDVSESDLLEVIEWAQKHERCEGR